MAEAFNLNSFLQEYKRWNQKAYTSVENGRAAMAQREEQRALEAVSGNQLLNLTLGERLKELGVGPNVAKQIGETALKVAKDIIDPFKITEYLQKYENIFDHKVYDAEFQGYAKQMYFANRAMSEVAQEGEVGQNFVYDM